jgi:hypothetical protein
MKAQDTVHLSVAQKHGGDSVSEKMELRASARALLSSTQDRERLGEINKQMKVYV